MYVHSETVRNTQGSGGLNSPGWRARIFGRKPLFRSARNCYFYVLLLFFFIPLIAGNIIQKMMGQCFQGSRVFLSFEAGLEEVCPIARLRGSQLGRFGSHSAHVPDSSSAVKGKQIKIMMTQWKSPVMGIRFLISHTNEALVEGCYSGGKNCHGVLYQTVIVGKLVYTDHVAEEQGSPAIHCC